MGHKILRAVKEKILWELAQSNIEKPCIEFLGRLVLHGLRNYKGKDPFSLIV